MEKCIKLNSEGLISSGSNRRCFLHPENADLCIKVLHENSPVKTQTRELRYFKSLERRKISWSMVARLTDIVQTNLGRGVVFELVRDFDGQVSKTLDHYLRRNDERINKVIVSKIEELKAYLLEEAIIFRDLITLNIVLRRTDQNTFAPVVVDGIGHNDFIPICNYSTEMSRKKIMRTWNRKKDKWFDQYSSIKDQVCAYRV